MANYDIGDHVAWESGSGKATGTITAVVDERFELDGKPVNVGTRYPHYEVRVDGGDRVEHLAEDKLQQIP